MSRIQLTNALQLFIKSEQKFQLVHSTPQSLLPELTTRLIVLDSSFNPPHMGHLSMIRQAIVQYNRTSTNSESKSNIAVESSTISKTSVLLLLSVKNADKSEASVSDFVNRLLMIYHMASTISEDFGVSCGIGLTKCSLFINKEEVLKDWICNQVNSSFFTSGKPGKFCFLVGFDTLVRLFNKKYYGKLSIAKSFANFFDHSEIFVLLRNDGKVGVEEQRKYLKNISEGFVDGVPQEWAKKIKIAEASGEWGISSSEIRKEVSDGDASWKFKVLKPIAALIEAENLYKNSS